MPNAQCPTLNAQRPMTSLQFQQYLTLYVQRAHNAKRMPHDAQLSTHKLQRSTHIGKLTTYNAQRSTHIAQSTTDNAQRTTENANNKVHRITHSAPRTMQDGHSITRSTYYRPRILHIPHTAERTPPTRNITHSAQREIHGV